MKTQTKIQTKKSTAVSVVSIEGHPVPTSSPSKVLGGLLSFKGDIVKTQNRSAKIQITKRKNCIKRLREEAEHFLWRIKEVEKHNNCEEYNSILFEKSDYNKIEGARPDLKKPLKLDGIIIGRHFVDGFRELEKSVRDEFRKVGG